MLVSITEIRVLEGRRPLVAEKVQGIAESVTEIGLLNPITISADKTLIAGLHRLEAYRSLGLAEIECAVLDVDDLLRQLAEIDENLMRANLTKLEEGLQLARRKAIYQEMYPGAEAGKARALGMHRALGHNVERKLRPTFTQDTVERSGIGRDTVCRRVAIGERLEPFADAIRGTALEDNQSELLALAKLENAEITAVLETIQNGSSATVFQARRELVHQQKQDPPPLPDDKYRIWYADPPWSYGNSGIIGNDHYGHAQRHYPCMSIEELCAMGPEIKERCTPDAVLFLWVTSPLLEECFPVIRAWGFRYKTSFVWDKVGHNFGHYNSVRHELLLVCTRGSCTPDVSTPLFDSVQVIEKSKIHSEKPVEFRQIIDTLYPHGKRIELFARERAENWQSWGQAENWQSWGNEPTL